jgi:hypothetical protein
MKEEMLREVTERNIPNKVGKFVINQEKFTKRHIKLNKKGKKRLYSSKILQKGQ